MCAREVSRKIVKPRFFIFCFTFNDEWEGTIWAYVFGYGLGVYSMFFGFLIIFPPSLSADSLPQCIMNLFFLLVFLSLSREKDRKERRAPARLTHPSISSISIRSISVSPSGSGSTSVLA